MGSALSHESRKSALIPVLVNFDTPPTMVQEKVFIGQREVNRRFGPSRLMRFGTERVSLELLQLRNFLQAAPSEGRRTSL